MSPKTNCPSLPRQLPDFYSIEVERSVVAAFRKDAIARKTSVPRLIRDLLGVIADDRLVLAILDDSKPASGRRR